MFLLTLINLEPITHIFVNINVILGDRVKKKMAPERCKTDWKS